MKFVTVTGQHSGAQDVKINDVTIVLLYGGSV
jgi:hypothetical protein